MLIHFARVYLAVLTHELQQQLCSLPACKRPRKTLGRNAAIRSWMHQCLYRVRHETVVDEEILLDAELRVTAFEVAGTVVLDSMAQNQILSAGGRADRVGLHKAQPVEGPFQRGWREEAVGDGIAPQIVERDRHSQMLRKGRRVIN